LSIRSWAFRILILAKLAAVLLHPQLSKFTAIVRLDPFRTLIDFRQVDSQLVSEKGSGQIFLARLWVSTHPFGSFNSKGYIPGGARPRQIRVADEPLAAKSGIQIRWPMCCKCSTLGCVE
jgi:hypothetical protein